ncbi:MAG: class I SAM-dependent methyltransferase [Ktedonobacterales bacterium]
MSQGHYARIADRYDALVTTDADLPFFAGLAQHTKGPILELMAGTGRVTLPLLASGSEVVAVDYSPEMLARLREKINEAGFQANIRLMDIRHLALDQTFNLILVPFHAFPEITDPVDQQQTLQAIRAHLAPEGRFVCTLHNPAIRRRTIDGQLRLARHYQNDQREVFLWLLEQDKGNDVIEVNEFFESYDGDGLLREKVWSSVTFHLLAKTTFEAMIHSVGFEVIELYGNYAKAPFDEQTSPFMIYVLQNLT